MRKLLSAAALSLALPFVLLLSGCGAAVDGRSFNPTSNNSDGTVAGGGPDTAQPLPVGLEVPDPSSNNGAGSGSAQTPATGSGSGSTQTPSTGSGSGSTASTSSGSATPPTSGSGPIEVDPASGTATLTWTAPTTNVDGSPLTELAGYAVTYGRSSGVLDQLITVNDAGATSYTVQGLESGVWYFCVRALATTGTQSAPSNIAATQID